MNCTVPLAFEYSSSIRHSWKVARAMDGSPSPPAQVAARANIADFLNCICLSFTWLKKTPPRFCPVRQRQLNLHLTLSYRHCKDCTSVEIVRIVITKVGVQIRRLELDVPVAVQDIDADIAQVRAGGAGVPGV